jgi:hypothetical protein
MAIQLLGDLTTVSSVSDAELLLVESSGAHKAVTKANLLLGVVKKTGTLANEYVAIWDSDGVIRGNTNFTWNGSTYSLSNGAHALTTLLSTAPFMKLASTTGGDDVIIQVENTTANGGSNAYYQAHVADGTGGDAFFGMYSSGAWGWAMGVDNSDSQKLNFVYSGSNFTTPSGGNSGATLMTLLTTGNVGIGTSAPDEILHIKGSGTKSIKIEGVDTTGFIQSRNTGETFHPNTIALSSTGTSNVALIPGNGTAATLTAVPSGYVGIGTVTPTSRLTIRAEADDTVPFAVKSSGNATKIRFDINSDSSELLLRNAGGTYTVVIKATGTSNLDGGLVTMKNLPTSAGGLSAGDIWSNGGVLTIV